MGGPPGGQQFGQPPMGGGGPGEVASYKQALQKAVQENGLERFYPPGSPMLDQIANQAAGKIGQLCAQWKIPKEIGADLVRLGLYDIILYVGEWHTLDESEARC